MYRSEDGGSTWALTEGNLPVHLEAGPLVRDPSDARTLYAVYSLMPYAEVWRTALEGSNLLARTDPVSLAGGLAFVLLLMIGGGLLARWLARQRSAGPYRAALAMTRSCARALALAALRAGRGGAASAPRPICFADSWSRVRFVEYPMAEPQDMPIAIAAAADGTVWFTIDGAAALGRVRDGQARAAAEAGQEHRAARPRRGAGRQRLVHRHRRRRGVADDAVGRGLELPARHADRPPRAAGGGAGRRRLVRRGDRLQHHPAEGRRAHPPPSPIRRAAGPTAWPWRPTAPSGRRSRAANQLLRIAPDGDDPGLRPAAARGRADRHRGRAGRRRLVRRVPRQQDRPVQGRRVRGVRGRRRRTPGSPASRSPTTARSGSGCCAPAAWAGCATASSRRSSCRATTRGPTASPSIATATSGTPTSRGYVGMLPARYARE